MWNMAVIVVLAGLGAFYAALAEGRLAVLDQARSVAGANSMALYRDAVIAYFSAHPGLTDASVDIATLKADGMLPAWSPLYAQPASSPWANYRAGDGAITVYATSVPAGDVVSEIVALSRNSVLAGIYRSGDATLFSPIYGNTGIPLPPAAKAPIPDGSPVWMAARK
jgi:hypothetical protein